MLEPIHQDPAKFDEITSWCPLPPKLIGEKVFLTAFDPACTDELLRFMTDETTAMGLGNSLYCAITRSEEEEILSSRKCNFQDGYDFLIWDVGGRCPIGTCSLGDLHPVNRCASIGINIGERGYRRMGRASEAMWLVLCFAFETLNLHSVHLGVYEYNDGAIECYRKLGFTEVGRHREDRWAQGRYWDSIEMDMLEYEWRTRQSLR